MNKKKWNNKIKGKRGQNFSSGSIIKATDTKATRGWLKNKEREVLASTEKKIGKAGHVYIFSLGYNSLHKIGCTWDIESRLKTLRAANPRVKCAWSAWVKDMHDVEKTLHRHFESYKVEREVYEMIYEDIVEANGIVNNIKEEYLVF